MSNNSTLYDEQLGYDAIGNVTTTKATLPAGTDNQAFCYDEQDRLTWSGSTGTPTCSTAITTGTLPTYQQSYSYDVLDRLTQGPAGSGYTYGDSAHLNAVTSANGYTATYDSAGNMTCRAKSGSGQSCTPTAQHGQLLTYDALGQLLTWQSSSSNSPSTESDAYDGEGHRVQRVTTPGGSTTPTTTTFVGSSEEVSVTSGTTTTIKYYAAGPVQVESINGSFSYLVQDHLGSIAIEMGSSGNLRGQQLFTPYGTQRYSLGSFNANHGFTDQYTDTNNGLDYYGARYYDPVVGQFVSADTVQGPNRYGYVSGNPETFVDPTGHQDCGFLGLGCVAGAIGTFISSSVSHSVSNAGGVAAAVGAGFVDVGEGLGITFLGITIGPEILVTAAMAAVAVGIGVGIGYITSHGSSSGSSSSGVLAAAAVAAALVATQLHPPVTSGGTPTQLPAAQTSGGSTPLPSATTSGGTPTLIDAPTLTNTGTSVSIPTWVAATRPASLTYNSAQFGYHYGQHKQDYPNMQSYQDYQGLAQQIFDNPGEVIYDVVGSLLADGSRRPEFYYIAQNGIDLLRTTITGEFVSLYPGADSPKVINARNNGGRIWP